jgi:hypothetical protein
MFVNPFLSGVKGEALSFRTRFEGKRRREEMNLLPACDLPADGNRRLPCYMFRIISRGTDDKIILVKRALHRKLFLRLSTCNVFPSGKFLIITKCHVNPGSLSPPSISSKGEAEALCSLAGTAWAAR